tara:strand:- start:560 stop:682 length:123 start_codon:yes stop_codon:yes gene_type:complete
MYITREIVREKGEILVLDPLIPETVPQFLVPPRKPQHIIA